MNTTTKGMTWERFDHTRLYDDGEYVIDNGRERMALTNETDHDEGGWYNVWCDSDGDSEYDPYTFKRIMRLDL